LRYVDADHGASVEPPHDVTGEVSQHGAVDQHLTVHHHGRHDAGQGDGGAQGVTQHAFAMHLQLARGQIGRHGEEGQQHVLHLHIAEGLLHQCLDLASVCHGDNGRRDVGQGIGQDEGLSDVMLQLFVRPAQGGPRGDDRPHGSPADEVDGRARLAQSLQRADVGVGAGAAA